MRMFGFIRNDRPLFYEMRSRSDEVSKKTQLHNDSTQTYFRSHTGTFQEGMTAKVYLRTGGRLVRKLENRKLWNRKKIHKSANPNFKNPAIDFKPKEIRCCMFFGAKVANILFSTYSPLYFLFPNQVTFQQIVCSFPGPFGFHLNSRWEMIGKMHGVNLCINLKLGHWFRRQS